MRELRPNIYLFLFLVMLSTLSVAQSGSGRGHSDSQAVPTTQATSAAGVWLAPDELKQELDAYAIALSKVPAEPLIQPDPLAPIFQPIDRLTDQVSQAEKLKFGATYTFLNQYATSAPDGVRQDQLSGRLDFTAAWVAYNHESSRGSVSMLVRSGTNIGTSQQFNLSDRLGSGIYLNCLQGGGAQEPITLNILYWRQDPVG
jgi:porin